MSANDAKTLWAWMTELADGSVSQVGAYVPWLGTHSSLVPRSREVIEQLRPVAELHKLRTGQRTFLREYRMVQDHGGADA